MLNRVLIQFRSRLLWKKLPVEMRTAVLLLNKESVVIDLGANVGASVLLFARTGATVVAYEPHPVARAALRAHTRHLPNVVVRSEAVSTANATSQLFTHIRDADGLAFSSGASLLADKPNVNAKTSISIETVDILDVLNEFPRIDILKMDIEGAEVFVILRMLTSCNLEHVLSIFAETHNKSKWPDIADDTTHMLHAVAASVFASRFDFRWP